MRRGLQVAGIVLLIALACIPGVLAWRDAGPASMSWQGWAAMIGGAAITAALAGGLMALVFYSDRRGFDERTGTGGADSPEDEQ